MTTFGDDS